MKIVSSFLESVAGIGNYPMISFLIFFFFFLAVTWYVMKLEKSYIREVSHYPIADNDEAHPTKKDIE